MKAQFRKLDKNNLPKLGEEIFAKIRTVGLRRVILVNDPDEQRGFFNLYKPVPAFFCEDDAIFYSMGLVESWAPIYKQTLNTHYENPFPK